MRKRLVFPIFLLLLTLGLGAQINVSLFPFVHDSLYLTLNPNDTFGVAMKNITSGITGSYNHHYLVMAQGDTAYTARPVMSTTSLTKWFHLDSLRPNTFYSVRAVSEKNGLTDTSGVQTFTTDSLPGPPQQVEISNFSVNSGVLQTDVLFHYKIGRYVSGFTFIFGNQSFSSATLYLTGEGDTSIVVTSPNFPCVPYRNNYLWSQPVGIAINDTFFSAPDYTVPCLDAAHVATLGVVTKGQDSIQFFSTVQVGNTNSAIVKRKRLDANLNVVRTQTDTITRDSTFVWTESNLSVFTDYYARVSAMSSAGGDSLQTLPIRTLQVLPPVIPSNWDTLNATTSQANLVMTVNTVTAFPSDTTKSWVVWTDRTSFSHTTDTVYEIIGTKTFTTTLLSNLVPGPGNNSATIYALNKAGLLTMLPITFEIETPLPGFSVNWGADNPVSDAPDSMTLKNLSYSGAINGHIIVRFRKMMNPNVYTDVAGPGPLNGAGIVTIGVNGLEGGYEYGFQIGGTNNGDTLWNSLEKKNWTLTAGNPSCSVAPADVTTHHDSIDFRVFTAGNGTQALLACKVYPTGFPSNPVVTFPERYVGTGTSNQNYSAGGFSMNTWYTINPVVYDMNHSNAFGDTTEFRIIATGVLEVKKQNKLFIAGYPADQQFEPVNIMGQSLKNISGTYLEIQSRAKNGDVAGGVLLLVPIDKTGVRIEGKTVRMAVL